VRIWQVSLAGAALLAIAVPEGLDSCGPMPSSAVFVATQRPANIRGEFLKGRVGVLLRSFEPIYRIGAFRILSGVPLNDEEVGALYPENPPSSEMTDPLDRIGAWWNAKGNVLRAGDPPIETYKQVNTNGLVYSFINCNKDAFETAAKTLEELKTKWGDKDPRTQDWIQAQDQVFENCSAKEPTIPVAPASGADPLLASHRHYQIAAAYFYAGQFPKATQAFERIAKEKGSPWQDIAPYLAARSLLRAGLLDRDRKAFDEGKKRLLAILKDPKLEDWHEPARNLLHLWQLKVEPRARMIELGAELMKPGDESISQSATDFLYALNHRQDGTKRAWTAEEITEVESAGELPAWMLIMSDAPPQDAVQRSMEWWRKTHKPAWLIASLANASNENLDELVKAAGTITPDNPAYESVFYYSIQRELGRGHADAARAMADRALAGKLLLSSRNLILEQRTRVTTTFDEFLKFALRNVEPEMEEFDGKEEIVRSPVQHREEPAFDWDSVNIFNEELPLVLWVRASASAVVPKPLQAEIAQAGWYRAVLVENRAAARQLMTRLVEVNPERGADGKGFLAARDADEEHFGALYFVLQDTVSPMLSSPGSTARMEMAKDAAHKPSLENAPFLKDAERAEGALQNASLRAKETWEATYLCREAIAWARKRPTDPRVPEALHLAVRASRFRDKDADTGKYSQQAFALLHSRYPKSEWTAKTPYWYK